MNLTEFDNHFVHQAMFDGQNSPFKLLLWSVKAVASGSSVISAFMHLSKTWECARMFNSMGETRRGERGAVVARLDLKRLFEDGLVTQRDIIDVSSYSKWAKLFSHSSAFLNRATDDYVKDMFHDKHCEQNSKKAKEVLIKWRGHLPKRYFTVPSISSSTV